MEKTWKECKEWINFTYGKWKSTYVQHEASIDIYHVSSIEVLMLVVCACSKLSLLSILYDTACRKSQNDLHLDPFIPILSFLLLLSYWWNVTHPYYVSSGDRFWVFNHSGVSTSTVFFMQHSTVLCSKVESTHQRYLETGTTLTVTISTESATA